MLSVKQKAKNLSGSHLENKLDVTVRKKYVYTKFRSLCLFNSHSDSDIEKNTFIVSFEPRTFGLKKILGCKPPAGSILSNCTSKGKKYTICTAKCANGNEGEWRTRCSKKKGKYIWDSIAAKVEAACN